MRYKIAECVTEYEPHYEMLRRKMEPYRTAGEGEPDIRLTLTKQFCEEKQKEQPHLTEAQCEYIFAGSEFTKNLFRKVELWCTPQRLKWMEKHICSRRTVGQESRHIQSSGRTISEKKEH